MIFLRNFVRKVLLEAFEVVYSDGNARLSDNPDVKRGVGSRPKGYVSGILDPYVKNERIENFKINDSDKEPVSGIDLKITTFLDYNYLAGKTAKETAANKEKYQKYMQDIKKYAKGWMDSDNPDPVFVHLIESSGRDVAKYYVSKNIRFDKILYPESSSYLAKQFGRSIAKNLNILYKEIDVNSKDVDFNYDIGALRKTAKSLRVNTLAIDAAVRTKQRTGSLGHRTPDEERQRLISRAEGAIRRARNIGASLGKEYEIKKIPSILRDFVEGGHEFNEELEALNKKKFLEGQVILIVDDNVSTAQTFKEIAKECYRKGAAGVHGSALWKWSDKVYPSQQEAVDLGWKVPEPGEIIESGGSRDLLFSFLPVGSEVEFYSIDSSKVRDELRTKKDPQWKSKRYKYKEDYEVPEVSEEEIMERMKEIIEGETPDTYLTRVQPREQGQQTGSPVWIDTRTNQRANFSTLEGIFKVSQKAESREEIRKREQLEREQREKEEEEIKAKKEEEDTIALVKAMEEDFKEVIEALEDLKEERESNGREFTAFDIPVVMKSLGFKFTTGDIKRARAHFGFPTS